MFGLNRERKRDLLAGYNLFAEVRYLAGYTDVRSIIDEEPINIKRRKKWQNEQIRKYLDNLRFNQLGFNETDAVDTAEEIDRLVRRGIFKGGIIRPFGVLSDTERAKILGTERGRGEFEGVIEFLQIACSVAVNLANFGRRNLPHKDEKISHAHLCPDEIEFLAGRKLIHF